MTCPQLRAAFAAVLLIGGFAACARPASQPRVVGPVIGESTAPGPRDSSAPPPDPGGVTETSARIHGTPSPVANPAITVDTMPSTLAPSGNDSTANQPVVVAPGVGTGAATTGTAPATGTAAAGPNGPGTGNGPATSTGAATGGNRPGTTVTPPATTANPPATTANPPAAAPTPAPSNGPGTGNTVNRTPVAPAPVVTPRSAMTGVPIPGATSGALPSTPTGSQR